MASAVLVIKAHGLFAFPLKPVNETMKLFKVKEENHFPGKTEVDHAVTFLSLAPFSVPCLHQEEEF